MYRIVNQNYKWYAIEYEDLETEIVNFETFLNEGEIVILSESIEEVEAILNEEIEII